VARSPLVVLMLAVSWQAFAQSGPLRFVADQDYPPVSSLQDGKPAGLYVDLARAVGGAMGQPFSVEVENWTLAQAEVADGRADVLYSVSYTQDREAFYDFTVPVTRNEFVFFSIDERRGLDMLDDVKGLIVGVTQSGLPRQIISPLPGVYAAPFATYQQGFEALKEGHIDAFAGDLWVGSYQLLKGRFQGIRPSRHVFASLPAGFAVRKGNKELLDRLNAAIGRLKASGALDKILNRWDPESVVIRTKGEVSAATFVTTAAVLGAVLVAMGVWIGLLSREIRRRKAAQRARETLVKELQHRTRNNMGVISALLDIQGLEADEKTCSIIRRTQNQIYAMALVHEQLGTQDLSHIMVREYVRVLVDHLAAVYRVDAGAVTITQQVEDLPLLIDTAVPLALILNVLVGNAIRHAFPPPRRGTIRILLRRLDAERLEVVVSDDGVGFRTPYDPAEAGLGLRIVQVLAEQQLKAELSVRSEAGLEFRLVFRDRQHEERV